MDHRDRQRQALPDPQGHTHGQTICHLCKIERLDQFSNALIAVAGRQLKQPRMQVEVLPHRQLAVEREGLRHVTHPLAGIDVLGVHRLAKKRSLAGAGR